MTAGRLLLASLDKALNLSQDQFRSLDIEVQRTNAALARNQRKQINLYQSLARQRLSEIAAEAFVDSTNRAESEAARLLAVRETKLTEVDEQIDACRAELEQQKTAENEAAERVSAAESALDALLAQVDDALADSAAHQTLVEAAQNAVDTAANAAEKWRDAQTQRETKRIPFEADPLFSYLWAEHYGTSDYRGGLLKRFMDGLVAKHVRYESARRNYHTLNEIPRQLGRHVERLETEAATAAIAVADAEEAADEAAGAGPLRADLDAAEQSLSDIETAIEQQQSQLVTLTRTRQAFADGRDPEFVEALKLLSDQMRSEPIPELMRDAALTPTLTDDELIETLESLRDEAERLQRYIEDHRDIHSQRADRMNELTLLRQRFRSRRFDRSNSIFDDRGGIETMLTEFLRGLISSDSLWQRITRAQRFQQTHRPSRRGGKIGRVQVPRMPRSVRIPRRIRTSRGGGGFRTKGGF